MKEPMCHSGLISRTLASLILAVVATGCSTFGGNPAPLTPDTSTETQSVERVFPERIRKHIYAGVGFGSSWMEPDTSEVQTYDVNRRFDSGAQLTLGMDLSRQIAIEAHAAELGSAGISSTTTAPGGEVGYRTLGASALMYLGKNRGKFRRQGLSAYGRAGYGYLENKADESLPFKQKNGNHLLLGAGVEYMTRQGLGLRVEGIAFDTDVRYAQLGLIYRTGRKEERDTVKTVKAPTPVTPPIAAALPESPACEGIGKFANLNFRTDSSSLTTATKGTLDSYVDDFRECSDATIRVTAHTDSRGPETYNQALSSRRAASVVDYLASKGIERQRLQAQPFGESQPISSNDTREGRRQNRRVEIFLER